MKRIHVRPNYFCHLNFNFKGCSIRTLRVALIPHFSFTFRKPAVTHSLSQDALLGFLPKLSRTSSEPVPTPRKCPFSRSYEFQCFPLYFHNQGFVLIHPCPVYLLFFSSLVRSEGCSARVVSSRLQLALFPGREARTHSCTLFLLLFYFRAESPWLV